jgi:hypothetical protein
VKVKMKVVAFLCILPALVASQSLVLVGGGLTDGNARVCLLIIQRNKKISQPIARVSLPPTPLGLQNHPNPGVSVRLTQSIPFQV